MNFMETYDWSFEGPQPQNMPILWWLIGISFLLCVGLVLRWYLRRRQAFARTPQGKLLNTLQNLLTMTKNGEIKPGVGATLALAACKHYWSISEQQPVLAMTDQELKDFLQTRSDQLSQSVLYLVSLGSRFEKQGPSVREVADAIALTYTAIPRG